MPYKSEKLIKLGGTSLDRRRKLSDEDRDKVIASKGNVSQRKCAEIFGISCRLVQFLWMPEKHNENIKRRQERGGSKAYYDKEKHRESMKRTRHYKQEIYLVDKTND